MAAQKNTQLGIFLMIATTAIFALQDAFSRVLGDHVDITFMLMIRFWFLAAFVMVLALRSKQGFLESVKTKHPIMQGLRGFLLLSEIGLIIVSFVKLGLIETHAVFVIYPLLVTLMSGPILGEKVGWRRWLAVLAGFVGVLVILQPSGGVFSPWALLPFVAAALFALYNILTRYVARDDHSSVSLFWTGIVPAILITPFGLANWHPISGQDWLMIGALCIAATLSNWMLIRAYDVAEASDIQPFAFFQLPFIALIGLFAFGETLRANVVIGGTIVVSAGLFTLWRQRMREKAAAKAVKVGQ